MLRNETPPLVIFKLSFLKITKHTRIILCKKNEPFRVMLRTYKLFFFASLNVQSNYNKTTMNNYTAKNIKIQQHTTDTWSMAISLAEEFNYNIKIIERGLEACKLAHVPSSYFIDKYLRKMDIPLNETVNEIYKELSRA